MGDVAKRGRTVLVVSHNMRVVETLTERCLYLKDGSLIEQGSPLEVIKKYQWEALNQLEYNLPSEFDMDIKNPVVRLNNITLIDSMTSQQTNTFIPGNSMRLCFELMSLKP